jgi:hypothetical protein
MSLESASPPPTADTDPVAAEAFTAASVPRRVLVYAPLAYSTPHFETDLEIAQRHLDLGDDVELVLCDGNLPSCQLNPAHESKRCLHCVSRNLQGAAQLSRPVKVHSLLATLTAEDSARLGKLPAEFANQDALRRFEFDGFDAGMAALSSLIDFARALTINTRQHATIIRGTLTAAVASFLATKRLLAAGRYDRVYIYNGRWSMVRSAVRACEQAGIEYYTHERGADFRRFALYHASLPHDKARFSQRVAATWQHASARPDARTIAETFFLERRQRVEKAWFSFVKHQETGRTPADWNRTTHRLVFFTSSEFEFAAIGGESVGRIYRDQVAGLRRIAPALACLRPDAHLWVRVHPNDKSAAATQRWIEAVATLPNVTLVRPDENVDSYAMLEGADRVLTFGSTVGIEATFWGRPAICADYSFFDHLDAYYEAADESQLLELLSRPDLPPKPREHVLAFGFYLNTFGTGFRHFDTSRISDYEFQSPFRGRCLKPDFGDLAQRVLALHQSGADQRAGLIARHFIAVAPDNAPLHAIHILSLVRQGDLRAAIAVLEHVPGHILETVLKHTGKDLLDATQQLVHSGAPEEFRTNASRLAAALLQTPAFAPLGQRLAAMAARVTPASAVSA